jgi:PAS domain S-box-containing protein
MRKASFRQDERELRELIDFLPQHILALDRQGKLLQANNTMLDFFGYTLDEMKGKGDQERIKRDVHPDDFERRQRCKRRPMKLRASKRASTI